MSDPLKDTHDTNCNVKFLHVCSLRIARTGFSSLSEITDLYFSDPERFFVVLFLFPLYKPSHLWARCDFWQLRLQRSLPELRIYSTKDVNHITKKKKK